MSDRHKKMKILLLLSSWSLTLPSDDSSCRYDPVRYRWTRADLPLSSVPRTPYVHVPYTYSVCTQGKHHVTSYTEITESHISYIIISNPLPTIHLKLNTDQQINIKACYIVTCQCHVSYNAHLLVSAFHISSDRSLTAMYCSLIQY